MQSSGAGFYRWDPAEGRLVMTEDYHAPHDLGRALRIRPGEGVSGRAFSERRVIWTDDRLSDPALNYSADNAAVMAERVGPRLDRRAGHPPRLCLRPPRQRLPASAHAHRRGRPADDHARRPGGHRTGQRAPVRGDPAERAELAEKSAVLEATLENISQGLMAFDGDLRLTGCNTRMLDLFGYPRDFARPRQHLSEFIRYLAERGEYGPGDVRRSSPGGWPSRATSATTGTSASARTARSSTWTRSACRAAATSQPTATSRCAGMPRRSSGRPRKPPRRRAGPRATFSPP